MEALKDPDEHVRGNAAESLGFFPAESEKILPVLADALRDPKTEVRRAAILAIGRVGKAPEEIAHRVREFTKDPDPLVQLNAQIALAGFAGADESSIPLLVAALGSKDSATAKAAARVLGNIAQEKPERALQELAVLLEKREQPAVTNALRVLRQLKASAAPVLPQLSALYGDAQPADRVDIMETLVDVDKEGDYAIPVLVKALKEKDAMDRKEALMNLMRYRLKAGEVFTDALVEALDDPNLENKLMTLGIIRGLADKARKASPKVIAMSLDPDVKIRIQAVGALSAFPVSVDVFEAIGRSLKDPEKQVRLAAAGALRRVGPADPMKTAELLRAALDVERDDTARRALSSALESVQNPPKASGPRSSSK